jgi:hypothetical protein
MDLSGNMGQFISTYADSSQTGINSGASANYTTVRNGNNLGFDGAGTATMQNSFDTVNYGINRYFLNFDTSTIPLNANIISASLLLVGAGTTINTNSESIAVVSNAMSGNTPLTGDWGNIGATSFGSVAVASWNNPGNNSITLNGSGLAQITKGGKTKLALRTSGDISNTPPTNPGNEVQFNKTSTVLTVVYNTSTVLGKYW